MAWAGLGIALALVTLLGALAVTRACPKLEDVALETREHWPRLSVIIPACNEATTLEAALESLRASDYANLEIILIDDRSNDGTTELVDRLSADDPRIAAAHVRELPEGWLGKVHALARGMDRASGEYVLFTDADVHFAPTTLSRAVLRAEREALDHLAIFPTIVSRSFLVGTCVGSACRAIVTLARPWEAINPRAKKAIGVGAFNLVRRSAFDKTPGLEWLRMEVADDIGLGLMMKRHGGKIGLALGRGLLTVEWYTSFDGLTRGLEKNGFAQAAHFRVWRGVMMAAFATVASLAPFAGFLAHGDPRAVALSSASLAIYFVSCLLMQRALCGNFLHLAFSLPLGDLLMVWIILRAVWLGKKRGGLIWRGTTYPTAALEKEQRVDF